MSGIWVYKADGTLQCQGNEGEISLQEMRKELAALVGQDGVLGEEKRQLPLLHPHLCGTPTGQVNAYEITRHALYVLFHGIVGPNGFAIWRWPSPQSFKMARDDHPVPWPWAALFKDENGDARADSAALINLIASLNEVRANPTTLAEIIGRPARCYTTGDPLTFDYMPERVNIEMSKTAHIVRIWFG